MAAGVVEAPPPVIFKDPPCRYPDAVRLVPEALVKARMEVETLARPKDVPDAELNVNCPAFAWSVPPIVTLPVVETLAMEVEAFKVKAPVELTNVKSKL